MPSLGSILSIASTALRTQQQAMEVTSHNIANVNTEGYSRQRAVLSPSYPLRTADGSFGTGVRLADVQQTRDAFADAAYRRESGLQSRYEGRQDLVSRIETVLGEPGDTGIAGSLDRFFSAWSELATDPSSSTARTAVLSAGDELTAEFHRVSASLDVIRTDAETDLTNSVDRVNALATEVADLNRQIVAAESGGQTAGDLRDQRGRALDELSTLVPVTAIEQENGSVRVALDGFGLVDGIDSRRIETAIVAGDTVVRGEGDSFDLSLGSGRIAGLVDVLNTDIAGARASLDQLAENLVTETNALHRTGTNPAGDTGVDFFDPTGVVASSISLSETVAGDVDQVAAGTGSTDVPPAYRAGANDVALGLAGLRDEAIAGLGGNTFGQSYTNLATNVGGTVRSLQQASEVHDVLAQQSLVRRESAAGVSVDEEMVDLIRFQSAYGAAARLVTTANQMMESLLRM